MLTSRRIVAKGNELWSGEVWTADHPGLGSVVMFDEPPSGLMTKKVAGAAPGVPRSTKTSDPVKAKWVSDLPGQLSPDEQHRLDLMTKGKSAGEVYDMFGGDLAVAKAKLGGSNLTPELYQQRASLTSDEARRAFDNKWNQMNRWPSIGITPVSHGEGIASRSTFACAPRSLSPA